MKNSFKPLKARMRATFAGAEAGGSPRVGNVDAENEVLHDVQITLEGEAKGHGVWLDREFCEAVAAAGNATGDVGLKVRYGHPAMCSDAIGTELGRAKNFRVVDVEREIDGEKKAGAGVIADVYLLKSAHAAPQGDIAAHVLEVAKEDPGQFGQSIVFTYDDWIVKDKDGARHSYKEEVEAEGASLSEEDWRKQSADGKTYAVLGKLHGSDFTDTPAATDGVFSTGTLAEEAELMLAEHPQVLEVLEKNPKAVAEFLARTGLAEKVESARVSGLQAAKDKEIAARDARIHDLEGQAETREKELAAEKDAASALRKRLDETARELAESRKRQKAAEDAHRRLTGGALTLGEPEPGVKSFADFVREHGNSLSRAVREDPETYRRLCAARGCAPVALAAGN